MSATAAPRVARRAALLSCLSLVVGILLWQALARDVSPPMVVDEHPPVPVDLRILQLDPATGAVTPVLEEVWRERVQRDERSGVCVQWGPVFHRPGADRASGPERTGVLAAGVRPGRLPAGHGAEPERAGAVSGREGVVRGGDAGEPGVAPAAASGRDDIEVAAFITLSGGLAGPDGLAMAEDGGLAVAHCGLGTVWLFNRLGEPRWRIRSCEGLSTTNLAYGGPGNRQLFITESDSGTILRAAAPGPGRAMYSHTEDQTCGAGSGGLTAGMTFSMLGSPARPGRPVRDAPGLGRGHIARSRVGDRNT